MSCDRLSVRKTALFLTMPVLLCSIFLGSSESLLAVGPSDSLASNAETRTWEGTWNNRKYGTKGPLKCVASETKPGRWEATFTGLFQGDPFKYKATFLAKKGRGTQLALSGNATIRGHKYQWKGQMKGKGLRGDYDSSVGYNGQFILTER